MSIPVVDFGDFSLDKSDATEEGLKLLISQLKAAFMDIGFVFLTNTGITQESVDRVMAVTKEFFMQPEDLKKPFSRGSFTCNMNHGWVSLETERLNPRRPGDLKESFNATSLQPDIKWPSDEFREIQTSFFNRCRELSLRVLRVLALSLDVDPEVFLESHYSIGTAVNATTLRSLYYPPVNSETAKEGQVRCGEHSDYGSITLLFQSSEGLQVRNRAGEFVPAPVIPGAVLINIADLMQRWTSDRFISVVHRVLLPPAGDSSTRQSMAFFVQPEDDAVITCCDGSNKYPPVSTNDYLMSRFAETYGKK